MIMWGHFGGRITSRNFLKMESESFQYVRLVNGVPKGTISAFLRQFTSNQIKLIKSPKLASILDVYGLFQVDTSGNHWTQKRALGLRKNYDPSITAHRVLIKSILTSVEFSFYLIK